MHLHIGGIMIIWITLRKFILISISLTFFPVIIFCGSRPQQEVIKAQVWIEYGGGVRYLGFDIKYREYKKSLLSNKNPIYSPSHLILKKINEQQMNYLMASPKSIHPLVGTVYWHTGYIKCWSGEDESTQFGYLKIDDLGDKDSGYSLEDGKYLVEFEEMMLDYVVIEVQGDNIITKVLKRDHKTLNIMAVWEWPILGVP
jgi:hypothetical protein